MLSWSHLERGHGSEREQDLNVGREEVREEAGDGDAPHDTLPEVCDADKPEVSPSNISWLTKCASM